jgi:hypothetical protein
LKKNGSVQGTKTQDYFDFARLLDAARGHFDQIPKARQNAFLERKRPWKGIQPSRRPFPSDMFAILPPQRRWIWGLTLSEHA